MWLRPSRCLWKEKNALYSESSSLPRHFFRCCEEYFKIQFHVPVYMGVRDSQVRGLFLSSETGRPMRANEPIATIPLPSVYSQHSIHQKPNALSHVSLEDVAQLIPVEEFRVMAPHLYMGLQFAAITAAIPDVPSTTSAGSDGGLDAVSRYSEIIASQANPWMRVIEDEDFNEKFVLHMYGGALDKWQRESFDDLTTSFHRCITAIHEGLKLHMSVDHFRRITRLVLARAERIPEDRYWQQRRWVRRYQRWWRRMRKQPQPDQLAMIPLLDLVNHSNRPNCGVRVGPSPILGGQPAATIFSLCPVLPGQELCRHYNFSLTRPAALFRYGFLPFDLISIVEIDPANEYLFKNQNQLRPPEDAIREKEAAQQKEVHRLEQLFQGAKQS